MAWDLQGMGTCESLDNIKNHSCVNSSFRTYSPLLPQYYYLNIRIPFTSAMYKPFAGPPEPESINLLGSRSRAIWTIWDALNTSTQSPSLNTSHCTMEGWLYLRLSERRKKMRKKEQMGEGEEGILVVNHSVELHDEG